MKKFGNKAILILIIIAVVLACAIFAITKAPADDIDGNNGNSVVSGEDAGSNANDDADNNADKDADDDANNDSNNSDNNEDESEGKNESSNQNVDKKDDNSIDVGYDLQITEIGSYSGPYMEDGSYDQVDDILMIEVKNIGDEAVQYGEITISTDEGEDALFKFSTLKPDETMIVLESTKKAYKKGVDYVDYYAKNVASFQNKPKLYSSKLEIQGLNGGLNVTNISGEDIEDEIIIYFKDYNQEQLTGGITYRGRIEGGLKAGEIRQLMSEHFTAENTKVVFVTIGGK